MMKPDMCYRLIRVETEEIELDTMFVRRSLAWERVKCLLQRWKGTDDIDQTYT